MPKNALLTFTDRGIHCPAADVWIDPWRPVERAVITHAHSDHARRGSQFYTCHHRTAPILKLRLGDIKVEGREYGEPFTINGVRFSLHPAGHIPGSAQVRVEHRGEVWVVSGDYKLEDDGYTTPFEPVKCDAFITECTFGLPIYRWRPQEEVFAEVRDWWAQNREMGKTSILMGYTLGKAQRLLTQVAQMEGRIFGHGAICNMNEALREAGVKLPSLERITRDTDKSLFPGSLVIAPPSARNTPWVKKFHPYATGSASGWMQLRAARRMRAIDRGFVLSDHADWPGLLSAIKATGAERIYTTHGYSAIFARYLREQGYDASDIKTEYKGELDETDEEDVKGEE